MAENGMTVAQAAAKMMKAYGARHIFTIAGSPLNVLYHCQKEEGIQVVLGRSERSIMSMADGYARLSGRPAFGYVQFGVGASALPPVFAEATWGMSPLIVLTGSTNTHTRERYEYQEVDALPMMRTCTKWAVSLPAPERIGDIMRSVVRAAMNGVPGPAFLEIPSNQWSAVPAREPAIFAEDLSRRMPIAGNDVERIAALLAKAKKPVILSGGEVIVSEAWGELVAFAEAANIPVVTSVAGKGSIAEIHPLAVGVLGRYSRKVANDVVAQADFVLAVGTQLSAMTTDTYKFPSPGTTIVHIAIDVMTLGRTYREALSVNADPKLTLAALKAANIDGKAWADWTRTAQQMVKDWRSKYAGLAGKKTVNGRLNPVFVMSELNKHVKGNDLVIGDTGNATRWAGALVDTKEAGRTYQRAAGSLGWAFPGGLGAKLAVGKSRRVFTVIGDGGIGYHLGDIETALRMDTPAITIVLNNASFAGYKSLLKMNMGRDTELPPEVCTFMDTNFGNVAKAYGAFGERVESPDEFLPALRRAEESGKPAIIDVATTPDARAPGGGPDSEL